MDEQEWRHLDVAVIRRETGAAFQVMLEDKRTILWLPKSQVADADEYEAGMRNCTMSIPEWLWEKKLQEREGEADA